MAEVSDSKAVTWAAHVALIRDDRNGLGFSAQKFTDFDAVIAVRLKIPALLDPTHADFRKYTGLRINLAALRHFLQSNPATSSHLRAIAETLGDVLSKDGTTGFNQNISVDVVGVEGAGAMAMYRHLLSLQEKSSTTSLLHNFKSLLNIPDRAWNLPALDDTPFSPVNLAAPADADVRQITPEQDSNTIDDPLAQSIAITENIVTSAQMLRSIDTLEDIPREESIEEARKILRWMRNMEFSDRNLEEFMDQGTPQTVVAKKQGLQRLVHLFAMLLRLEQQRNAEAMRNDPSVQNARESINTIALEVAEHTRNMLLAGDAREAKIDALIDSLPDEALLRQNQSVERLLENVELGLDRVSSVAPEMPAFERLNNIGNRLEATAAKLSTPDNLQPPVREESLELARDILRRLKNMSFSDKPLAEFIETARPEEKVAFAQQVDQMTDMYKNLLSEAAQTKPELLQEETVKQGAQAVSSFTHSVKLMAAKEMPSSIASAQHISAEAARNPEQWADMHQHTVNRLIKSAEGALEKAIEEVSQQQEQDQNEEQSREAIEQALNQSDQAKRKKRRKGDSKPRSGKSGKRQRKQQQEHTADDYVLKQGRFSEDAKTVMSKPKAPKPMTGLKEADLAAIRELGGTLRGLNELSATLPTASETNKVIPDKRKTSDRASDRDQKQNPNAKGGQGPRV